MDYVLTTIEGDEASHDEERGSGSYAATIGGMRSLASMGHGRLGVVCPVHGGNVDSIEEALRVAESLRAQAFFQPTQVRDGWRGASFDEVLSPQRMGETFLRVREWKQLGRPVGNSMPYLNWLVDGFPRGFFEKCLAGRYFFTILPDGRLIPWCMTPWDRHGVKLDLDDPGASLSAMGKPDCDGCTILPYVENTLLLRPHPASVWNAIRW